MNPTRRAALISGASAAFAAISLPAWPAFGIDQQISGCVFADERGNGIRRNGARGIPGVLVSNGVDVACSNSEGLYRLPLRAGLEVFVIAPAGLQSLADPSTNLPMHYRAVPHAAGNADLQIDFPLVRTSQQKQFDAILMADPQPENHRHLDFIRDGAIPAMANVQAAFGLTLGDIVGDNLSLMTRYNAIMGQAGTPWWNAGGNHDLDYDAPDHASARRSFRRAYGPASYAFEQGEAMFIVLDNVEYAGCTGDGGHGAYRGRIGAQQLTFVRNLLRHVPREKLIVLAMHIPLRTEWNPLSARDNTSDASALLSLLAGRRAVSFSGHMHAAEHLYLPVKGGAAEERHHHHVLAALSGSWWSGPNDHRGHPLALGVDGCPPGFHVLHVDGADYSTSFVPMNIAQECMRISLSRCTPCTKTGTMIIDGPLAKVDMPCELIVNIFDGGPRSQARMRMRGGEWIQLAHTRRADPFMIDHFAAPGVTRHDWVKPEPCEHLWTVNVPDLPAGLHRVEVEVRDEYARLSRQVKILEIAAG